ncbi:hypothetical protein B0H10DRAFT_2230771 [Mycena sp. CBHHK59/15]|nr:hypothetical protein B0H10DRAFT_2230771 [Mycena sp. CBHHK59/15]
MSCTDPAPDSEAHRFCSPKFFSYAACHALAWHDIDTNVPHHWHTVLDDFFWILVWESLRSGQSRNLLSLTDKTLIWQMNASDRRHLAAAKEAYLLNCVFGPGVVKSFVQPFRKLLNRWAVSLHGADMSMGTLVTGRRERAEADKSGMWDDDQAIEDLCLKVGRECVQSGLSYRPTLEEKWPPQAV